jgi:hypothetical protein
MGRRPRNAAARRQQSWWNGWSDGAADGLANDWPTRYRFHLGAIRTYTAAGSISRVDAEAHLAGYWAGLLGARRGLSEHVSPHAHPSELDDRHADGHVF